jgi:hypothetical protein
MYNCGLTSVDLTGCAGIKEIDFRNNFLDSAAVDGILVEVESWGTTGSYPLNIDTRFATGLAAAGIDQPRVDGHHGCPCSRLNILETLGCRDAGTDSVSGTVAVARSSHVLTNGGTSALTEPFQ